MFPLLYNLFGLDQISRQPTFNSVFYSLPVTKTVYLNFVSAIKSLSAFLSRDLHVISQHFAITEY